MRCKIFVSSLTIGALALVLAACGGSSKSTNPPSSNGPTTTVHVKKVAENVPSESAKMVCEPEAIKDIEESATGVKTSAPVVGKWDLATHTYSCDYVYTGGAKFTLSVHEMSSDDETTAYFKSLAAPNGGKSKDINGLGSSPDGSPAAYQTVNGNMVVRKDFKVLLVDITKLPASFGVPADTRGNVAINVAETILGCWTGA